MANVQHSSLDGADLHPAVRYVQGAEPSSGMATGDLWFDTDDGALSVYDGAAWTAVSGGSDAPATLELVDDFVSRGAGNGSVGELGWNFTGGTGVVVAAEADHPGIFRRTTSAVSGSLAYTHLRSTPGTSVLLPAEDFDATWVFRLNTNDGDTRVKIGFFDNAGTATPGSGIYLEKEYADTEWFGVCRASSVETRTAALATVDTGWHAIRMRRVDAGTIGFSFDGGAEATLTTNIPNNGVQPAWRIANQAAADKTIDMDLFTLTVTGLGR